MVYSMFDTLFSSLYYIHVLLDVEIHVERKTRKLGGGGNGFCFGGMVGEGGGKT